MERNGLNLEGEKLLQYQNAMDVLWMCWTGGWIIILNMS